MPAFDGGVSQQSITPTPLSSPTQVPERAILRRVHLSYFKLGLEPPIQPEAFRPTLRDVSGISGYFESDVSAQAIVDAIPADKRDHYIIARIPVGELALLGLTVRSEAAELPGHAVIPELRSELYQQKDHKQRLKDIQIELARIASRDIVYRPPA